MSSGLSTIKNVAIFGSADITPDHEVYQAAYETAKTLGSLGLRIVNGGGPGVMKAATDGARAGGGKSLAVTFHPVNAPYFEGRDQTNFADEEVVVEDYFKRLGGLIEASEAFVIFQGGTGTLSEWTTVWLLSHIYYGHHKPIVLFGEYWHDVMATMNEHFFIGKLENEVYRIVTQVDMVLPALRELEMELLTVQAKLAEGQGLGDDV